MPRSLPMMPSTEVKEDPRLVELAAVNRRLNSVLAFLKTKHTEQSLNTAIERAEAGLGDHSAMFVPMDNAIVHGTRHLGSLLQLVETLEIKAEIGHADHALDECTSLLGRKVELLREIYRL
jgi:hypothetical protein